MKDQIRKLTAQIHFVQNVIVERQKQLDALIKQRASLYRDGGLLPFELMEDKEKQAILKLPKSEKPCEYCERIGSVRVSKRSICLECGHQQL